MSIQRIKSGVIAEGAALNSVSDGVFFRNRIINGDMRIDQRNAGAAVTVNGEFSVDRFRAFENTSATFTAQRSTTAPSNYSNSLLFTVGSAASATAAQYAGIETRLEGFNVADIGFGTSACKPVALSFVVRSSVTGTYCVSLTNSADNRVYVAEYTINSANTFETKSVTVPAITSGTWLTDNGIGVKIWFDLGSGTDRNTTASAWQTNGPYSRTTNQTNFINNAGATFYITGVQLEVGSVATPFERRPYGTELALCQRYYQKSYAQATVPGTSVTSSFNGLVWSNGVCDAGTGQVLPFTAFLSQPMRATPTLSYWDAAGNASKFSSFTGGAFARTDNQGGLGSTYLNSDALIAGYGTPGTGNSFAVAYAVSAEI